MGVRGLATYIRPFFRNVVLHNTYIVIDGNALAYFFKQKSTKCCFGGEYDKLSQTISEFFDDLAKCQITALVIFDGGNEERRLPKAMKTFKKRISEASRFNRSFQGKDKCNSLFMKEVLKEVMNKKGIKYVQGLFEGDYNVASLARFLNCPVLSQDSDYCIYGVKYIPLETFHSKIIKTRTGYVKSCNIFDAKFLLQRHRGLEAYHLPLIAVLAANDYVETNTFVEFSKDNFFDRIDAAINWLKGKTIHTAISQMLSSFDEKSKKEMLEVLEMSINMYTTSDPQILRLFGYSKKFALEGIKKVQIKPFKFQEDVSTNDFYGNQQSQLDEDALEINKEKDDPEFPNALNIYKVAPSWFVEEFYRGVYVSQLIDILSRRLYFSQIQVEDHSKKAAITICTKILTVIYTLLTKDQQGPKFLTIYCRDIGNSIKTHQLELNEQLSFATLPNLFNLGQTSLGIRQKILNETLEISENGLKLFPDEWKLFLGTVNFWMSQQEEPEKTNSHLYSVLFGMLFGVVDRNIGYYRSEHRFFEKYGPIDYIKKQTSQKLKQCLNTSDAYNDVSKKDCLLAAPFLLKKFQVNPNFQQQFDISIVHAFSQFQICLWHSMQLNALLGFPYQQTIVSEMLNGTLLYNLYCDFQKQSDIDAYISQQLKDSPSLLRLFKLLLDEVRKEFFKTGDLIKMMIHNVRLN